MAHEVSRCGQDTLVKLCNIINESLQKVFRNLVRQHADCIFSITTDFGEKNYKIGIFFLPKSTLIPKIQSGMLLVYYTSFQKTSNVH